jgi:hypothetical protein
VSKIGSSEHAEYGFYISLEDVASAYSFDITSENDRTDTGRRRDDLWHEFNSFRKVKLNDLHPKLSNRILETTGIYPYSEKPEVEADILSRNGYDAVRVADSTEAHYYFLGEEPEILSNLDYLAENQEL